MKSSIGSFGRPIQGYTPVARDLTAKSTIRATFADAYAAKHAPLPGSILTARQWNAMQHRYHGEHPQYNAADDVRTNCLLCGEVSHLGQRCA